MTHFKDGSAYTYTPGVDAVNIGWLDSREVFPRGAVPADFVCRLKALCRSGVNRMRGLYRCSFCPQIAVRGLQPPVQVHSCEGAYTVGGAEIRVNGIKGLVFYAPDMIVHYVEVHGYRPAEEFIEAVLATREL